MNKNDLKKLLHAKEKIEEAQAEFVWFFKKALEKEARKHLGNADKKNSELQENIDDSSNEAAWGYIYEESGEEGNDRFLTEKEFYNKITVITEHWGRLIAQEEKEYLKKHKEAKKD